MLMTLVMFFYYYHNVLLVKVNTNDSSYSKSKPWLSMELKNDYEYLIDTPGCAIPNVWNEHRIIEPNNCNNHCGARAVYVEKLPNNKDFIEYTIKDRQLKKIFGNNTYECCSQFAVPPPHIDRVIFTPCIPFVHGTRMLLLHEIITVKCELKKRLPSNSPTYEDAYIVLKERPREKATHEESWNVLILGMDTMSRARAFQSMPKLVKYLKFNNWLDYRGFQKAESNTYPNLMILHTGKKSSTYFAACKLGVDRCNDLFMWSNFKRRGYFTVFGEDHIPNTMDFKIMPTDHYTRPLLLLGVTEVGNIVCLRNKPIAHYILNYAYQFVEAYKKNKFYGFFWLLSYSHNPNRIPTLLQNRLVRFFEDINNLDTRNNTIIIFLGDHGIRYGPQKVPVESYYDEQLPMLFMKFPRSFRERHTEMFSNLKINQHRLTTHCDLHSTLWQILKLSDNSVTIIPPEFCPQCSSLFEEKSIDRRCENMEVTARWCSCHALNEVQSTDIAAILVPEILLYRVINETKREFEIKSILRHHWFRFDFDYTNKITYYLLAIQMVQDNMQYEGVVKRHEMDFEIIGEINKISPHHDYADVTHCVDKKTA